jgi:2-polyprenyl-6-methoxyphenol hydroxylase-like FAD-dependent oxidoreductase
VEALNKIRVDSIIFGGGVSGLWTFNVLKAMGLKVILVETQKMGFDQTITCQGILHGGIKYSLAGKLTKSAINIREMPDIWKQHIAGEKIPNLSKLQIRSEYCYLWGKSLWLLGSLIGLSVRPKKIKVTDYPKILSGYKGDVYKLPEQIISPASLLNILSSQAANDAIQTTADTIEFKTDGKAVISEIRLRHPATRKTVVFQPKNVILCAGAGNGLLRRKIGFEHELMQRRPLRMVLLKGKNLPFFNGHYVEGTLPTVTITSAKKEDGNVIWALGGRLAEDGVSWSDEKMIQQTGTLLQKVFPNKRFETISMAVFSVDRAEADTNHCNKPDDVFVEKEGNVVTAWPTKLVLAPRLADRIADLIQKSGRKDPINSSDTPGEWQKPVVAQEPWETVETWYTVY